MLQTTTDTKGDFKMAFCLFLATILGESITFPAWQPVLVVQATRFLKMYTLYLKLRTDPS
jgi:hypothetical protein